MMKTTISPDLSSAGRLPKPSEPWTAGEPAPILPAQRIRLEAQGCRADNWDDVLFSPSADLSLVTDVDFHGCVAVGRLVRGYGRCPGLRRISLTDCVVGDDAGLYDIPGGITRAVIGSGALVRNVASVSYEPEAPCGTDTSVCVLDETGSRPVRIYPGLSAQMAVLAARSPRWAESHLSPLVSEMLDLKPGLPDIGAGATVVNCGPLVNVSVGREACVDGARRLVNGAIVNNAASGRQFSFVGTGVDAENFIFEDARVDSGVIARNVYAGQGVVLEKGFSAHDSLFFANSSLENGEACALLAGPYTVSMHKASLLIGVQTSFMNAGSASNQSNHMYKLGPVHWGVLERGVKTSSNSYLMLGADIGAFSLLMGSHKTHPDSTAFPFSYLFGDEKGTTIVVPAAMLRSCGLMRDEKKWPARDRRLKRRLPLHDRIVFRVLSPFTVERMLAALPVIEELLRLDSDPSDRYVRWRGMKFTRASLERASRLYRLAVARYLTSLLVDNTTSDSESLTTLAAAGAIGAEISPETDPANSVWVDLGGQILLRSRLDAAMRLESVDAIENAFTDAFENLDSDERRWVAGVFNENRLDDLLGHAGPHTVADLRRMAAEFDRLEDEDRETYLSDLQRESYPL